MFSEFAFYTESKQDQCIQNNGNVKYPNTKRQSLINSSIIIKDKEIQNWFLNLDESLNINKWIMLFKNMNTNKHEPIGKAILNKMQKTLGDIISNLAANALIQPPSHPDNINIGSVQPCYIGNHGTSSYQLQASDTRHNPMAISLPIYHVLILPNNYNITINFC